MKESAHLRHKPPLRSAALMVEIRTDRDKVTARVNRPVTRMDMGRPLTNMGRALMNKEVTRTDMGRALTNKGRALTNKAVTMEDTAMDRTNRPATTRDMVQAQGNTADMGDTGDIDMDGVVMDRHVINERRRYAFFLLILKRIAKACWACVQSFPQISSHSFPSFSLSFGKHGHTDH